jgi:hypothetical protein
MAFRRSEAPTAGESGFGRHAAWLLVSLAYLYVFPYYERLNNPNENARVWMTRAIVTHHTLAINKVSTEWGYVNDKAVMEGRLYSGKAPGTSLLGVPVLWLQTQAVRHLDKTPVRAAVLPPAPAPTPSKRATTLALRLFTVALPLCVFLFFFARYVERITGSPAARDLLVVGLGLGTLMYPYGVIFVGHAQAAALAFSGYMLLSHPAQSGSRGKGGLLWAGAFTGLAVLFEYQVIFAAALLAVYAVVVHRRRSLYFFVGALPAAVLLGAYHTALFGKPWHFPFGHIENPQWAKLHNQVSFFGLGKPNLHALGSILFSVSLGLFVFSPFLLLGVVGAIGAATIGPRRDGLLILGITVLMALFLAGVPNWHAGWCVGPRYITVVAPFLAAGVAHLFARTRNSPVVGALTGGLVIAAVFLCGISAALYPHYPEQYDNPVFDLALPLLRDGFFPYSLGRWLGLPGVWALVPLALVMVAALSLGIAGDDLRPRRWVSRAAVSVVLAAIFLLPISRYGRTPRAAETQATSVVRQLWEPAPRR